MDIKNIETYKGKLKGQKVFLRADFNVPIHDGKITDTYRIDTTMKTFDFLQSEDAITIVVSHIETKDVESSTLVPVYQYIKDKYPAYNIYFCKNFLDDTEVEKCLSVAQEGDFILFENIRNADKIGMSEKGDDLAFAEYLKRFADFYINDAFAVSHRSHTSVSKLPSLYDKDHKVAGIQMHKEISSLSVALNPQKPFVAILSGAKFSTKLPLIEKYLESADMVFVGGALYNNVLKSLGYEVGVSLIDKDAVHIDTLVKSDLFTKKIYIPEYVVVKNVETGVIRETHIKEVNKNETIQDISTKSVQDFMNNISVIHAKTIIWNGPIGNFENKDFSYGTLELGKKLLDYAKNFEKDDVHIIIGGGDTVSAIQEIEGLDSQSNIFISTGGGAMLEFLEKEGDIPGVVSLM